MSIIEDISVEISPNQPVNRVTVEVVAQDAHSRQTLFALNADENIILSTVSGSCNGSPLYILPEISDEELSPPCDDTSPGEGTSSSATLVDSENDTKVEQMDLSDTSMNCSFLRNSSFNPILAEDCLALQSLFSAKPGKLAVSCRENGSLEHIGRIEIKQGIIGSVLVVDFQRAIPNSTYTFCFEVRGSIEQKVVTGLLLTEDTDPLSKQMHRLVKLRSIPAYQGYLTLTIVSDQECEGLIVDLHPQYYCTRSKKAGTVKEFRIPSGELPDIQLKRNVDVEIYQSRGLHEAPLAISNSTTFCYISPGASRSLVAKYQMEFTAVLDIDEDVEPYRSLLCEIEIAHGPVSSTELLLDSHFLADCSVTLCEDGVTSILHAIIPPQKSTHLSSLQLRFERRYANTAGAIYVPKFKYELNPKSVIFNGSKDFEYQIHSPPSWTADAEGRHFECVDPRNAAEETMALQLPNRFPPPPRIREAKYSLWYYEEGDGLVTVTLQLNAVIDSSTAKVGQEILNVSANGFWGKPNCPPAKEKSLTKRALTRFSFDRARNRAEVFLRSKSWKRDIDVNFAWKKQIFNRGAKWMFYAPLPQICQDNIDFITVDLIVDDTVTHCGYIKSGSSLMKLKNDKIALSLMGGLISHPVLCISKSEVCPPSRQLQRSAVQGDRSQEAPEKLKSRARLYLCLSIVLFATAVVVLGRDYFDPTFQDRQRINKMLGSLLDYN
ncbi:hypothetical protein TRVA0_035S00892 [Trichomonascus vanleenenianus]|uniref:uncharacterized protein n=1 Tax=Trichomonascus vanleenenianus TaxID=2268995 RepID=UPI003ECADC22